MKELPAGITEGQTLTSDVEVGCDVCVIGSGPGGAVAASVLQAAGLQVVVLEEGGYFTKARFRQREDEAYPFLYQDGGQRTTKDTGVTVLQGKAVGGGTVINWTTCFRTPDTTVARWNERHAVGGVSVAELAPHFDWAEERLNIAESPLELANAHNRTLYDGCKKLGWDVAPTKRNVKGCAQTGHCGHGCPIDAKQSTLVTLLPDAIKAGAAIVSRCRVDRVQFDGRRATAVHARALDAFGLDETGVKITIKPRFVILAAGAINSPGILLRSDAPDPHGRTGLRTFLHPVVGSIGVYDALIRPFAGAPQSIASHHFADRGDEVGYFLEVPPLFPMLLSTAVPGLGADHAMMMGQLPHLAAHIALTIDGHHDDVVGGRVVLQPSGAPILDYPIVERQWRAVRAAQKSLAEVAFASGAKAVYTGHDPTLKLQSLDDLKCIDDLPYEACRVSLFSAHQMGGCGMSDDPKGGVVRSQDLRHHDVDNLHVLDGSVFPTSLGVNPQESIFGLTHLIATRLVEQFKA